MYRKPQSNRTLSTPLLTNDGLELDQTRFLMHRVKMYISSHAYMVHLQKKVPLSIKSVQGR